MASWKQINEVGGTAILRIIAGLFALLPVALIWFDIQAGAFRLSRLLMCIGFFALMAGYAVAGNRLGKRRAGP